MSRILLTGSSGFLGKEIGSYLRPKNSVFNLNRGSGDYKIDLGKVIPSFNSDFDIVIHAAGKAHSKPKTQKEKNDFFEVNVLGTSNLLKGLEESSCIPKSFLYISSVSVYGKNYGINISENEPLLAKDPYGLSKIEAELLITNWCMERNVICNIFRLPLVVGENPPGNLGSMINGIKRGFYFNIDGGDAKKSMVLASDIAKFILQASEVGGTYNLTDGIHPTFNELSKIISLKLGKSFVSDLPNFAAIILAKFGDILGGAFPLNSSKLSKITSTLTFDDSKARLAFGWEPTSVLEGFKLQEDAK